MCDNKEVAVFMDSVMVSVVIQLFHREMTAGVSAAASVY
jgi:hypothetical protein